MVEARIAQLRSADSIVLSNLSCAAVTMHLGGGITWPVAAASALARDAGRVEEIAKTQRLAADVVEAMMAHDDWPQVQLEITAAIGFEPGEATDEEVRRGLRGNLTELLWTILATEVVADRLSDEQLLHGRGVWLTGFAPVGDLPGPQWRAPRPVLERLYAVLRPLGPGSLLELAERHCDDDLTRYTELANAAEGWALVAAAGCPWRGGLDQLPGAIWPGPIHELREWATVMTSAACHRERLSPDDVATLTTPFLDLVPDLPSVISAGGR
jgi:hypothetical protein